MSHVVKSKRSLRCHVTCKLKRWRPFCFALRSNAAFELSSGGLGAAAPIIKIVLIKCLAFYIKIIQAVVVRLWLGQFEEHCIGQRTCRFVFSRDKLS